MYRKSILLLAVLALAGLAMAEWGVGFMTAQEKKTDQDGKREADKQAIDKLTKDATKAFENRDAAALVAHWTADGEFVRNDGVPIRGRDEIQKAYAEYFKTLKVKPSWSSTLITSISRPQTRPLRKSRCA